MRTLFLSLLIITGMSLTACSATCKGSCPSCNKSQASCEAKCKGCPECKKACGEKGSCGAAAPAAEEKTHCSQ